MILPFKTKWPKDMEGHAGQPTYFIEKIWEGLLRADIDDNVYHEYMTAYQNKFGHMWDWMPDDLPELPFGKTTTIREGERWNKGDKIHFYVNNRTKDAFQFAPVLEVVKVQHVFMTYYANDLIQISVNGRELTYYAEREELALKDGFDSWEQFFGFFYPKIINNPQQQFTGQIIHWTPLKSN